MSIGIHPHVKLHTYQLKSLLALHLLRTGSAHWIIHGEQGSNNQKKTLAYRLVLLNS